jgi:hypothetical protein
VKKRKKRNLEKLITWVDENLKYLELSLNILFQIKKGILNLKESLNVDFILEFISNLEK